MIEIEKIDFEMRKNENNDKTSDAVIYEIIHSEESDYYRIGGLKLYFTAINEKNKRIYAQKIVDYVFSLNDELFKIHAAEYEKPKFSQTKYIASITSMVQPERSKREDSQKCGMRCSEHCGNTVRKVQ